MQDLSLVSLPLPIPCDQKQPKRHEAWGVERIVMLAGDIKDSGDIEQDMDIELLIYQDDYYSPNHKKGLMEINVAKNHNGHWCL